MRRYVIPLVRASGVTAGLVLLGLLLLQPAVYAQSSGTLFGTVYDQAGAVVPGANVTLVNQATNDTRKTASNEVGYFAFAAVLPGTYNVKVEAQGFKGWVQTGIVMYGNDKRNISDISLQVGATGESVTVEATASEVSVVDSGERSATLTTKDITNLALEGRDVTELIKTLPGFSAFSGGSVGNTLTTDPAVASFVSAVGNSYTGNGSVYRGGMDLTSDGAHIIDAGCNCSSTKMVNPDVVSEVKVQTSNFGADSAKGPVVVNTIGKAGATAYHGEGHVYVRHGSLNSVDYYAGQQKIPKAADRYVYPGIQFSGPVPHTNKKLLFWSGWDYYYQSDIYDQNNIARSYVPTLSNRQGDFSATAADNVALCQAIASPLQKGLGWPPWCRVPTGFDARGNPIPADGIIPQSMWDAGGIAYFSMFPLPNVDPRSNPDGYNYINNILTSKNGWALRNRVDYNYSDKTKVYFSWDLQTLKEQVPIHLWWTPTFSIPYPGGLAAQDKSNTLTGHFVHVFSPSLTNDFTISYNLVDFPLMPLDLSQISRSGLGYPYQGVFQNGDPLMPNISNGYWMHFPHMDQADLFRHGGVFTWKKGATTFEDNVSKVYRNHMFKFGFYVERNMNYQGDFSHTEGEATFGFNGPYSISPETAALLGVPASMQFGTDMPMANILLGVPSNFSQTNQQAVANNAYWVVSWYGMDSWKIAKRLTLELGLRFDHIGPWYDTTGQYGMAVWVPSQYANDLKSGLSLPGLTWMAKNPGVPNGGWSPRFAWVSPRLGLAWDVFGTGKTVLRGGWGAYRWQDQWNNYGGASLTAQGTLNYSSPQAMPLWAYDALGKQGTTGSLPASGSALLANDNHQPVTYSWNFTISQQLPFRSLFEIAYVGNRSADLTIVGANGGGLSNINQVPLGALLNVTCPDGTLTSCPIYTERNNANTTPYKLYGAGYSSNNLSVSRHAGFAHYNALQASWLKRAGRLAFNLNYTWSKNLGTWTTAQLAGDAPDFLNFRSGYGPLSIDRSHVVNMSYSFEPGDIIHGNKVLEGIANGWTISGITSWQSGPNMQSLWIANFGLGVDDVAGLGPVNNKTYLGTDAVFLMPVLVCDPTKNLAPHQYINGACFKLPDPPTQNADGTWNIHNGAFQMPYIHGPAYFNSDLSVYKSFKVTEKQSLQFRVSGFNFLNHPLESFDPSGPTRLHLVAGTVGDTSATSNPTKPFGYATTKMGRRVVEFSLKYTF